MAIQEQHDGEADQPAVPEQNPAPMSVTGTSRRRFAKAGLGASGVLLTLTSQPGMACSICTSPSGQLSGGLKSRHGPKPVCMGRPPSQWRDYSSWSPSRCKTTTMYGEMFSCKNGSHYKTCDFKKILQGQSFDSNKIAQHCAAALLNVHAGLSSFLTEEMVKAIWYEYHMKGYYRPTAGKKWYAYDILTYLKGTMD